MFLLNALAVVLTPAYTLALEMLLKNTDALAASQRNWIRISGDGILSSQNFLQLPQVILVCSQSWKLVHVIEGSVMT